MSKTHKRKRIAKMLKDVDKPVPSRVLGYRLDMSPKAVGSILSMMYKDGEVERERRGDLCFWEMPE